MTNEKPNALFITSVVITFIAGAVLLFLTFYAPTPTPPLYLRTYDIFLQILSVGALGIVGSVAAKRPAPPP
jgi:ABC-type transport system involved in multi-copper enzyme maturation permease subunit